MTIITVGRDRIDTATGAIVSGPDAGAAPAGGVSGPVGANGLPLGQLRTAEGTSTFLIDAHGQAVIVGPGEVQQMLQHGYTLPNADQQAWTQNAMASRNPSYYPTNAAAATPAAGSAPGGGGTGAPITAAHDYRAEARALFPWIPDALVGVFVNAWAEFGDPNLAMGALRQDSRYDSFFPGNRRDDGTVRAPEGEYLSTMEGYDRNLRSFGLDPASFAAEKVQAFQNNKSPNENLSDLGQVYVGVMTQSDNIRAFYSTIVGATDLSDSAIFGSAIKRGKSPMEFQREITSAQIGGTAKDYGFDVARQDADRLTSFGLNQQAAQTLYAKAAGELPSLNELLARHNDPKDSFSLNDYTDAVVLHDPSQMQTIGRLYGEESSLFSPAGSISVDKTGREVGLTAR